MNLFWRIHGIISDIIYDATLEADRRAWEREQNPITNMTFSVMGEPLDDDEEDEDEEEVEVEESDSAMFFE